MHEVDISSYYTIGTAPHGGYINSLLTAAALAHQRLDLTTPNLDPVHLSTDFLSPALVGPAQVELRTLTNSKRWTRLE